MNNKLKSGYLSKITGVEKVDDTTAGLPGGHDGAAYSHPGESRAVFVRMYPKHIWEGIEDPSATPARMLSAAAYRVCPGG